jgi:hypothetical protein
MTMQSLSTYDSHSSSDHSYVHAPSCGFSVMDQLTSQVTGPTRTSDRSSLLRCHTDSDMRELKM